MRSTGRASARACSCCKASAAGRPPVFGRRTSRAVRIRSEGQEEHAHSPGRLGLAWEQTPISRRMRGPVRACHHALVLVMHGFPE
jgi:hypothetical protein